MRKIALSLVGALVVGLAAGSARAVTYEDSFETCNYPKTFDLIVLRPISFMTTVVGAMLFGGVAAPIALVAVPSEIGTVWDNLAGAPARFTFSRPLGECTSVELSY